MRLLLLLSLSLILPATARELPLWDTHESVASYAQRVKLPPTKSLDIGNGVKLDLVLIPAGRFIMGTPEPVKPSATIEEAIAMIVLGGVLTIGLFILLRMNYRKIQKRHFSLGWLLMLTATVGLFIGGIARGYSAKEQWIKYYAEIRVFSNVPANEKPAHEVTISQPFYMGKYTVTQEQYEAVMKVNPSYFKTPKGGGPTHPVELVSWDDAISFCKKVKAQLPTEGQWEYACRAETRTEYYSGDKENDLEQVAWFYKNSANTTHPVGGKSPNAFGLYDVHGNVCQWCGDGLRDYTPLKQSNPKGPIASNSARVLRGGSWFSDPWFCRSASRYYFVPGFRSYFIGFRICLPLDF